jgi:tetratricopeptide (TPR) repeat protein
MGGYAAVRFADAVGASHVLAISPQYSLDPKKTPFETRWQQDARRINWGDGHIRSSAKTVIVYDPMMHSDRRHLDLIKSDIPVSEIAIHFAGHGTLPILNEINELRSLLSQLLTGIDVDAANVRIKEKKKTSPSYLAILAERIYDRHPQTALALAERAHQISADNYTAIEVLTQILKRNGQPDRAAHILQGASLFLGRTPVLLHNLSCALHEAGRTSKAIEIAAETLTLAPSVANFQLWMARLLIHTGRNSEAIPFAAEGYRLLPNADARAVLEVARS